MAAGNNSANAMHGTSSAGAREEGWLGGKRDGGCVWNASHTRGLIRAVVNSVIWYLTAPGLTGLAVKGGEQRAERVKQHWTRLVQTFPR